ncbi:hypothetical protein AYI68_g7374 [Smittium mucronatum]|uniref:DH domain-containing protein n=1 Tax=Smittium mucronatum TaxID=133383 RepID=A0A1R0GNV8_9FUNG|nr:hypothetical protein AYI68_g7374 [Smittium mucronatum]
MMKRSSSVEDMENVGYDLFRSFSPKKGSSPTHDSSDFDLNDSVQSLPQNINSVLSGQNNHISHVARSKTEVSRSKSQKSSLNTFISKDIIGLNPRSLFSKTSFGYSKSKSENVLSTRTCLKPVVVRQSNVASDRVTWKDSIPEDEFVRLDLSKTEIQKQQVIFEAIVTEGDYLRDLKIIRDLRFQGSTDRILSFTAVSKIIEIPSFAQQSSEKTQISSIQNAKENVDNFRWLNRLQSAFKGLKTTQLAVDKRRLLAVGNSSLKTLVSSDSAGIFDRMTYSDENPKISSSSDVTVWLFSDMFFITKRAEFLHSGQSHLKKKKSESVLNLSIFINSPADRDKIIIDPKNKIRILMESMQVIDLSASKSAERGPRVIPIITHGSKAHNDSNTANHLSVSNSNPKHLSVFSFNGALAHLDELAKEQEKTYLSPSNSLSPPQDPSVFNESREYLKSKCAGSYSDSEYLKSSEIKISSLKKSNSKNEGRPKPIMVTPSEIDEGIKLEVPGLQSKLSTNDYDSDLQSESDDKRYYSEEIESNYEKIKAMYKKKLVEKKNAKKRLQGADTMLKINSDSEEYDLSEDYTTDSSESEFEYELGSNENLLISVDHVDDISIFSADEISSSCNDTSKYLNDGIGAAIYSNRFNPHIDSDPGELYLDQGIISDSSFQSSIESIDSRKESYTVKYLDELKNPDKSIELSPESGNGSVDFERNFNFENLSFENLKFSDSLYSLDPKTSQLPISILVDEDYNDEKDDESFLPKLLIPENLPMRSNRARGSTSSQETEAPTSSEDKFFSYRLKNPDFKQNKPYLSVDCGEEYDSDDSNDSEDNINTNNSESTTISSSAKYSSYLNDFMSKKSLHNAKESFSDGSPEKNSRTNKYFLFTNKGK